MAEPVYIPNSTHSHQHLFSLLYDCLLFYFPLGHLYSLYVFYSFKSVELWKHACEAQMELKEGTVQ